MANLDKQIFTEDSEPEDRYSQFGISVERLFSNTEVSDNEFNEIAWELSRLEKQFRQDLIQGFCQSPVN